MVKLRFKGSNNLWILQHADAQVNFKKCSEIDNSPYRSLSEPFGIPLTERNIPYTATKRTTLYTAHQENHSPYRSPRKPLAIPLTERSRSEHSYINFLIARLFLIKNSAPEYKVIATTQRSKP
ncbi:MAG: hypothetical protein ACI86M_003047 [Saprospiraceae bacterium]|jgi:hypothetical protein